MELLVGRLKIVRLVGKFKEYKAKAFLPSAWTRVAETEAFCSSIILNRAKYCAILVPVSY